MATRKTTKPVEEQITIEDEVLYDYLVTHDLPIHSQINKRKFKAKAGDTLQLNEFEASILKHYVTKTR